MKQQAVNLGRIGILLPLAFFIPVLNNFANLASIVLLLISHYRFSRIYNKPIIFNAALAGYIIQVLLTALFMFILVKTLVFKDGASAVEAFMSFIDAFAIGNMFPTSSRVVLMIVAVAIGFLFIYFSLRSLSQATGVKYFNIAGLLYLIGSLGLLIYYAGIVLIFVAWIFHIIAYFSVKAEPEEQS